jgi:MULE transposase domain/FLYWCH zinc finger domain
VNAYDFEEQNDDPADESTVNAYDFEEQNDDPADEEDKVYSTFLSQKGKLKITVGGYCYEKNRDYLQDVSYWRCEEHKLKCRATLKVTPREEGFSASTMNGKHNHLPDARRVIVGAVLADVRHDAKHNFGSKPSRILRDMRAKHPNQQRFLPPDRQMKGAIKYIRAQNKEVLPKEPVGQDFEFNQEFFSEHYPEAIFREHKDENSRVILITTLALLRMLCVAIYQMGDGTFWTAPKNFYQLFIIHAPAHRNFRQAVPCVFALLTGKAQSDYNKMFEMLIKLADDFNFQFNFKIAISDFEFAIRNAYKRYFDCTFMACSFHLKQSMIKLLGTLHLRTLYGVDATFQQDIHAIFSLSFVPGNEIKNYFDELYPILTDPGKFYADAFKVSFMKAIF